MLTPMVTDDANPFIELDNANPKEQKMIFEYIDNLHPSTLLLVFLSIYVLMDKLERFIRRRN